MRCYQAIGLKDCVSKWLDENVEKEPSEFCPHCKEVTKWKLKVVRSEHYDAFYDDGPTLNTYQLKNGHTVEEVIQIMPWSSGPMAFLCLKLDDGTMMFEWTGKEINEVEAGLAEDTDDPIVWHSEPPEGDVSVGTTN